MSNLYKYAKTYNIMCKDKYIISNKDYKYICNIYMCICKII